MAEQIIELKNGEKLVKRQMKFSDLEAVDRLAKTEEYSIGLHNWKLYYETSPSTWYVIVNENGDLIAYDTYNRLSVGDIRHGFQIIVRQDYRGKGISRFFETMHYMKHPGCGNATADSLLRYKFERFGDKLVGYEGLIRANREIIKPRNQADFTIETLNPSHLQALLNYDSSIIGFDREKFTREWVMAEKYPCKTATLIATRDKNIYGYGTIRDCSGYTCIAPVYADDDIIAEWLLYKLVQVLPVGTSVYIYFPAKSRLLTKWVNQLNMICCDTEFRDYINNMPKKDLWDMKRVYAMHDYYPV